MKKSIDSATRFLIAQLDKGYSSFSSSQKHPWQPEFEYQTTFVPSLILQSLNQLNDSRLGITKQHLYDYLIKQKSEHWSFNYWIRDSGQIAHFPYPDDLDDTFCALIALHGFHPNVIEEVAMANVVKLLIANELKVGGPYRTWLTTSQNQAWQDVDVAVNANITYFLKCIGSPLPTMAAYLKEQIDGQHFDSPYYPSSFPVWYYLARVCPPEKAKQLAQYIAQAKPNNSLETALALTALSYLEPSHRLLPYYTKQLIKTQQDDGSWPAAAFCMDPTRNGQTFYHGAATLTTTLAVEALTKVQNPIVTPSATSQNTVHSNIVAQARSEIQKLPSQLGYQSTNMLAYILKADPKHHITLLPHLFGQSYPLQPLNFYQQLGLANLYGWMAYTIYDDFLDEEGQPALLPVANFALRASLRHFQAALPTPRFQNQVLTTFNTIDEANTWEVTHCRWSIQDGQLLPGRLPHYGQRAKLAERSLGHCLTPLAVMQASGLASSGKEVRSFQAAFRHYLIARQLDDDAHDWQDDICKGHLNYVATVILHQLNYKQPMTLTKLLPLMQQQFWHRSLLDVCDTTEQHLKAARQLSRDPFLQELLSGIEKSVRQTRTKQRQATNFLANYKSEKNY